MTKVLLNTMLRSLADRYHCF